MTEAPDGAAQRRELAFPAQVAALRGALGLEEFVYAVNIALRLRCVYVETPKAGCSTIKHSLINAELGRRVEYAYFRDVHLREYSPLLSPRQVGDFRDYLATRPFVFCFVRDPYERLLSAYLDKIARPGPFRAERCAALGLVAAADPTFADFIGALERTPAGQWDAHWRPQVVQTCARTLPLDFVGRFERLEADLRTVFGRIGAPFEDAYAAERRHRTGSAAARERYYGPSLKARVAALYRDDFETFGYAD